jgi:hypothetical protein
MATTAYTPLLGLALPITGDLTGTWGDVVNSYITNYLDAAVAGTNTLTADSDVTLTKTTNSALTSTSSQYAIIIWTAGGTVTRTIVAPAASSGSRQYYIVANKTSSTQSIKLCGTGPTTGVTIPAGNTAICLWTGSDFQQINLTPTGTETLTNKTLTSPVLTNPTVTNYVETLYSIGNSSTAVTIALTNGTVQTVTMTGNCTFTMPTATASKSFVLMVNTGAGSFTAAFTGVKWPNSVTPILTTTASRRDIFSFISDGTAWYGNYIQTYTP